VDDGSPAKEKRKVKRLYVEADEDHLSGNRNKRRRLEPKLVYVHEGRKRIGRGRTVLVHAKYFGGMYKDPERLWWEVYWVHRADLRYRLYRDNLRHWGMEPIG